MPTLLLAPKRSVYFQDYYPPKQSQISRTVLLLHGLGATGESWGLQVPSLIAYGCRVIVPDMTGFGSSKFPGGSNHVGHMAADMAALLDHLGGKITDIIGISMGGTIALQLALDYPGLVCKLVLVNTFARLRPKEPVLWWHYLSRLLLVQFRSMDSQARLVAGHLFPNSEQSEYRNILIEQIRQADPRAYRSAVRSLARFNVKKRLGEIDKPALVISGEHDTTVPLELQRELALGIPSARQVIIPNSGHAVIAEQPDTFNNILLEFLNE